jgi:hypothetical protein
LGHILDLSGSTLKGAQREREAGRLHFRNFSTTTLGRVLLASMPQTPASLKTLLMNSGSIARSVFKNTNFSTSEQGGKITITMENSDYPVEHFEGFFDEWMRAYGVTHGAVAATAQGSTHHYAITGL